MKPCPSTTLIGRRFCVTNSAIRFVMAVARSGGHTREKLWSVLCVLQLLLESFVHLLYSSRCFPCKWLIKLDVPPPSASCWIQRRHCTRFTSLQLTFVTSGGSKNSQMELVSFLYAMALFWLSAALLVQLLLFTCVSCPAALFPCRYRNGSGNEIKKTKYLNPDTY